MSTLQIYPPWEDELQALNQSFHSPTDIRDPYIISYQYYNTIVFGAAAVYGVKTDHVYDKYVEAQNQNTTQAGSPEAALEAEQKCVDNTIEIIDDILSELFGGTIWLYGCAGGILICSALLTLVRHDHLGNNFRSIEFVQMGAGVVLCLVNLTALGDNFFGQFLHKEIAAVVDLKQPSNIKAQYKHSPTIKIRLQKCLNWTSPAGHCLSFRYFSPPSILSNFGCSGGRGGT